MVTVIEILTFLIRVLGSLYLSIILLRFMLQAARADFYNPVSQMLVTLTNPVLVPLRRFIPGFWGIDVACLVFALLFHWVTMQLLLLVNGHPFIPPQWIVGWSIVGIMLNVSTLYTVAGFVLVIASFLAPHSSHPILLLLQQVLEPLLAPIRRLLPSSGGLDFSLFFVLIGMTVLRMAITGVSAIINTPLDFLIGYSF